MSSIFPKKLPPSPQLWEILFNARLFLKNDIAFYEHFIDTYGDLVLMKFGDFEMLLVNDPEVIKHILKTNYTNYSKPRALKELEPLLKDGIFFMEDEDWKRELAVLKPAFHQSMIDTNEYVVKEELSKLIAAFEINDKTQNPVEISSTFRHLFLRILIRTQCSPSAAIDQNKIMQLLSIMLDGVRPGGFYKRVLSKNVNKMAGTEIFKDNFPQTAQSIEDMMMEVFNNALNGTIEATGIMYIILQAYKEKRITLQTVKGEMRNLVFAGMDTVGDSITWFLNNLMLHPKSQARCREEVNQICRDSLISYNEVDRFVYFFASFRESLRLNPAVWAFHRMTLADDEVNGYTIPKGVWIFISPYFLHRNKNYWSDALEFKPERFIGKTIVNPYHYIPFGQGPHYCLGSRIAQLQILQVIGSLLKYFEFERVTGNSDKFYAGGMFHPAYGINVHVKRI